MFKLFKVISKLFKKRPKKVSNNNVHTQSKVEISHPIVQAKVAKVEIAETEASSKITVKKINKPKRKDKLYNTFSFNGDIEFDVPSAQSPAKEFSLCGSHGTPLEAPEKSKFFILNGHLEYKKEEKKRNFRKFKPATSVYELCQKTQNRKFSSVHKKARKFLHSISDLANKLDDEYISCDFDDYKEEEDLCESLPLRSNKSKREFIVRKANFHLKYRTRGVVRSVGRDILKYKQKAAAKALISVERRKRNAKLRALKKKRDEMERRRRKRIEMQVNCEGKKLSPRQLLNRKISQQQYRRASRY